MASLNVDLNYHEHPKTLRLIGLLGSSADVFPLRLWAYVGKHHASDGKLSGYTPQEIEAVVGWRGDSGKCVEALMRARFLHKVSGGYQVHDWLDHAGHIHAFHLKAKKMAQDRWDKVRNAASIASAAQRSAIPPNPPPAGGVPGPGCAGGNGKAHRPTPAERKAAKQAERLQRISEVKL